MIAAPAAGEPEARVRTIPRPLLVAGAACVSAGVGAGWTLRPDPGIAALLLAAAAVPAAAVVWRAVPRHRIITIAVLLVLAGGGLLRGGLAAGAGPGLVGAFAGPGVLRGTVAAAPAVHRGEVVMVVEVDQTSVAGNPTGTVAMALPGRSDAFPGDLVEVEVGRLRSPDDRPGPLSSAALSRQGVDAVAVSPRLTILSRGGPSPARLVATVRNAVAARVDASVPEPDASLLEAIAFGIHRPLSASVARPLQDAGLAHLEATSGLKVVIVAGLVAQVLALVAVGPRTRRAARLGSMLAFVAVAGGGAAAARSTAMAAAGTVLRGGGRRVEPLVLLSLVAMGMLAVEPRLAADLGFQLSVLGTLGIVVLAAPVARRVPGPRLVAEALAVTVAAELFTAPIQAEAFGTISLIGPLANAVVLPLLPVVMAAGWAGVALAAVTPGLGAPLLSGAGALAGLIDAVARLAAAVPGAAIHPAAWPRAFTWTSALVLGAGLTAWPAIAGRRAEGGVEEALPSSGRTAVMPVARQSRRLTAPRRRMLAVAVIAGVTLIAGTGAIAVAARPDGRLHVSVLDVGAGTAVLVRTSAGGLALIDAGPDPARLLTALGAALPPLTRTLDAVILTGGERAVTAGLADLGTHYAVSRVVVPDADLGSSARAAVLRLRDLGATVDVMPVGTPWRWGDARFRCVGAAPVLDAAGPVRPVCALQVADPGGSALVLGDLAGPEQEELAAVAGQGVRSDLLVTPPNGLLVPGLATLAAPLRLAVPCARAPRTRLSITAERTTAEDGTLAYAGGTDGLQPA